MRTKKYKRPRVAALLRQIELDIAEGKTIPQACRRAQIAPQTFYRWRKELGGVKRDQAKRLKRLQKENAELKQLVAKLLSRDRF
jgi:transposase-like protein